MVAWTVAARRMSHARQRGRKGVKDSLLVGVTLVKTVVGSAV